MAGATPIPRAPDLRPEFPTLADSYLLDALILGVVEGITEFIPVSSTGHLILARDFLGYPVERFDVLVFVIQLAAILAICLLYFGRLWRVLIDLPSKPEARRFVIAIAVAFVPSVVLGLLLDDFMKRVLFSPWVVAVALLVGGVVILRDRAHGAPAALPRHGRGAAGHGARHRPVPDGLDDPGRVARRGHHHGRRAARARPQGRGRVLLLPGHPDHAGRQRCSTSTRAGIGSTRSLGLDIAVASLAAFVTAIIVVRAFVSFLGRHTFAPFGWYRIAAGLAMLAYLVSRAG